MENDEIMDLNRMFLERTSAMIENLGMFALKVLLTLNSGATVVLLALLGNLQDGAPALTVDIGALQLAMLAFLIGLTFAMAAIVVTYVMAQNSVMRWPDPDRISFAKHLVLMIAPSALSFLCFAVGFLMATFAFG